MLPLCEALQILEEEVGNKEFCKISIFQNPSYEKVHVGDDQKIIINPDFQLNGKYTVRTRFWGETKIYHYNQEEVLEFLLSVISEKIGEDKFHSNSK